MVKQKPDIIIFRIKDDDSGRRFVQLSLDKDNAPSHRGKIFNVHENDGYNLLEFNQIVLAQESDGGAGSIELCKFTIGTPNDDIVVYNLLNTDLTEIAQSIISIYAEDS